jgi:hypothetical protein
MVAEPTGGNSDPVESGLKYHCIVHIRSLSMKTVKPPAVRVLPDNPASTIALPQTGDHEFLSRGLAAGAKARATGAIISAVDSIARLKALTAQRAARSKP